MNPILIVEDNEKNLKLVRDVLRFKGYLTIEATTAAVGLRLAREEAPVLVLMDIQLPDFDGITALKRLRGEELTRAIPVIALSASAMPRQAKKTDQCRAPLMPLPALPHRIAPSLVNLRYRLPEPAA